ncbi:hypothetical protein MJG53_018461 [Ovis ammon polii x Ovis aries]|uniref:Uncharacterized protein n=1 Tax=Ovis ammon polii x Ovis aries TaxID=2918886 RepID=A0ACB9U3Q4_9CETA|nr:hypothetical protein MJG53_018461 [Ovis ammon polii x Ovis aries]
MAGPTASTGLIQRVPSEQDLRTVLSLPPSPGELLHPVVYACTAVMLLCLLASAATYVVHQSAIRISRLGRHTLLNFCLHAALTFSAFAGGINRTRFPTLCQAVGIALHYSTLSALLWIGVTARNIYKQVTRKAPLCPGAGQPPHPRQPLLRPSGFQQEAVEGGDVCSRAMLRPLEAGKLCDLGGCPAPVSSDLGSQLLFIKRGNHYREMTPTPGQVRGGSPPSLEKRFRTAPPYNQDPLPRPPSQRGGEFNGGTRVQGLHRNVSIKQLWL